MNKKNLTINEMKEVCKKLSNEGFGDAEIWIIPPCEEKTMITIQRVMPDPSCTGYDEDMIIFKGD